jgi:chorismate synthase
MLGNTFGRMFRVTTCGESYGKGLAAICDGVPPGMPLCDADIQIELDKRRPGQSAIDSPRQETDQVTIFSGLRDNITTGAPVGMIIHNVDTMPQHVKEYEDVKDLIRPGHAEYTYRVKYDKYADWCGAGRASGRETCARVAAGAVAKKILAREDIHVVAYVNKLMHIEANVEGMSLQELDENSLKNEIFCPDLETAEKMIEFTRQIKDEGDTVGGVVEIIAQGVPPGLGEPVFDKLSASLAHGLMSIPAVKGCEIGAGFGSAMMKGSECNDIPYMKDGRVRFHTNNSGGIDGGISNGEEIVVRIAVKPTSTISIAQPTVNMATMQDAELAAITRRDATICGRMCAVAAAMTRMTLLDHLMMWRGYDAVSGIEHNLGW